MIKAIYDLDMTPRRTLPIIINVSQYDDIGRTLVFNLFSSSGKWTAPTSAAVTFEGGKPDGKFFAYSCAYSNGTVTVTIQQQMTAVAGKVRCKIKVTSGDKVVESAPIIMVVDAAAVPDGSDMSKSDINDAVANATQKIVEQVAESIPADYPKLSEDVSLLKEDIDNLIIDTISSHEVTVKTTSGELGDIPLVFRYQTSLRVLENIKLLRLSIPLRSSLESDEVIVALKDSVTDDCNIFSEKTFSISNNENQFYDFDMELIVTKGKTLVLSVTTVSREKTLWYSVNYEKSEIGSIAIGNGAYDFVTDLSYDNIGYIGYVTYLEGVRSDLEGVRSDLEGVRSDLEGVRSDLEGISISTDRIEDNSVTPGKLKSFFKSALQYDLKRCTPGKNLLDPKKLMKGTWAYRANIDKDIVPGRSTTYGSYILPANKNGYVTSDTCGLFGVLSWIAYDNDLNPLRQLDGNDSSSNKQYIYEEGDEWVAFCFYITDKMCIVEGTEYTYEPYYDDDEVKVLQEKIEAIEGKVGSLIEPIEFIETSPIYTVCNDKNINRNYVATVWIDHLMKQQSWFDKRIGFTE